MKKVYRTGLGILALAVISIVLWIVLVLSDLPDASVLRHYRPAAASEVLDRNGAVITQYYDRKFRIWVPISALPDSVVQAVVIAEDDTFFEHNGVNYKATWEALVHDVQKRRFARGGSTITQQMIKNVLLSREKTLGRKLREYVLARNVEDLLTKREILEIYLNEVEWGENIFGMEAAARFYLDKHVAELTPAEAALLAGMLPNPRYFNPFKRMDKAKDRQYRVLFNMFQSKLLTEQEFSTAVNAPLTLRVASSGRFDFSALGNGNGRPCYQKALEQLLLSFYGDHVLYRQGVRIRTTLDKSLQDRVATLGADKHDAAFVMPGSLLLVKEGGEVRAISCASDEDPIRFHLDSPGVAHMEYELFPASPGSIGKGDIVVLSNEGAD